MDHSAPIHAPLLQRDPEAVTVKVPSDTRDNESPVRKRGGAGGRVRGLPQLLAINALVCGVEIVSSAAFTYIPPLLLKAGYTETLMTIILGIAPFLDMVTVPLLAEWSDQCTSALGRRRPFIMFLSTILLFSLIIIPHGPTITSILSTDSSTKINMIILAMGVILLDYSYQALFNPCESLMSDLMATSPEWEQTRGFTVYSASISLGCILGYLIVSIDWSSTGFILGSQEQMAFSVIFVLFLPCLFLTLCFAKEKPYTRSRVAGVHAIGEIALGEDYLKGRSKEVAMGVLDLTRDPPTFVGDHPSDGGYESGSSETEETAPLVLPSSEMLRWRYQRFVHTLTRLPRLTLLRVVNGVLRLLWKAAMVLFYLPLQVVKLPLDTWRRVSTAPDVLRRLFLSELFGWMGIMCHNMFFTDFVGQYMYGGLPDAPEHTPGATLYDEGVRMASWGLFLHSLTACLYAFFVQQHLVHIMGHRAVFLGGMGVFFLCMAATIAAPSITFINIVTALSGVGFAAITSTPSMLVTLYNSDRQLYMWDDQSPEGGEERGLGTDVAVLDTAFFLAQIILSVCMGPMVDLTGSALPYMVVAAFTSLIAVYCGTRIVFLEVHLRQLRIGQF